MTLDCTGIFCYVDDFLKELDVRTNFITDEQKKLHVKAGSIRTK